MMRPKTPVSAADIAAEALFCSDLQPSWEPSHADIRAAVPAQLRGRDASHRCLRKVAAAYGNSPELAAERMRWCRSAVGVVFHLRPAETGGEVEA